MKTPTLNPGDMIGVFAPSSYVEREDIEASKAVMEELGYQVFVHPQTYARHHQSAGTHEEKAKALYELWDNKEIKAMWAAGGGNRALHLIDHLDFTKFKEPKILIGFSDVTALLNAFNARLGITTYHGPVFKNLYRYRQMEHLRTLLSGKDTPYPFENCTILQEGAAEGQLVGGNLSVFLPLVSTPDCPDLNGAILFLEDCDDHISRFDRMLLHLKRQGVLGKINGLIIGEFLNLQDSARPYGFTLEQIIREHTQNLDIPVVMNTPFGHGETLYTLPIGTKSRLEASRTAKLSLFR